MKQTGFTLIELIIALIVISIAASIALPAYNNLTANSRLSSTANGVLGSLNLARAEAVKRGTTVQVSSLNTTTVTNWGSDGYQIWIDADSSGAYNAGEELRVFEAVDGSLTLTGDVGAISFRATGFLPATQTLTLSLCSGEAGVSDRQINVLTSGRSSIVEQDC